MSISSIGSTLLNGLDGTGSSSMSKMQQAWQQLENSLKSGDLDDAKKAYSTITQLQQQMSSQSGSPSGSSQFASDMKALGDALNSGNLSDAQQAFATVQKDMSNHPHPSAPSTNSSSSSDSEILQLLQELESSSSKTSSSSGATTTTTSQGISVNA